MAGWIKRPLGRDIVLGPDHIVRWGSSSPKKGHSIPHFSAHVYCGQTAGWIKIPLATEVDLGPGDVVLDGDPALPPTERGTVVLPLFLAHVYCGQMFAHLSYCWALVKGLQSVNESRAGSWLCVSDLSVLRRCPDLPLVFLYVRHYLWLCTVLQVSYDNKTRWLYCVQCLQYSIRLEALGYLCDCLSGRAQVTMTSDQSNLT